MTTATATAPSTLARFDRRVRLDTEEKLDSLRFKAVVALVLLNAMDLLLTRQLLAMGGTEMNPAMALVINGHWGIAIKLGVPILVGASHLRAPLKRPMVLGLCWVCVLYFGVVLWNASFLIGSHPFVG